MPDNSSTPSSDDASESPSAESGSAESESPETPDSEALPSKASSSKASSSASPLIEDAAIDAAALDVVARDLHAATEAALRHLRPSALREALEDATDAYATYVQSRWGDAASDVPLAAYREAVEERARELAEALRSTPYAERLRGLSEEEEGKGKEERRGPQATGGRVASRVNPAAERWILAFHVMGRVSYHGPRRTVRATCPPLRYCPASHRSAG